MRVDGLLGAALVVIGIAGIVTWPTHPAAPLPPSSTAQVIVALRDLPAGTDLVGTDPDLTTNYVVSKPVPPAAILPGALRDIYHQQTIHLLAGVKAGQQITSYN